MNPRHGANQQANQQFQRAHQQAVQRGQEMARQQFQRNAQQFQDNVHRANQMYQDSRNRMAWPSPGAGRGLRARSLLSWIVIAVIAFLGAVTVLSLVMVLLLAVVHPR